MSAEHGPEAKALTCAEQKPETHSGETLWSLAFGAAVFSLGLVLTVGWVVLLGGGLIWLIDVMSAFLL